MSTLCTRVRQSFCVHNSMSSIGISMLTDDVAGKKEDMYSMIGCIQIDMTNMIAEPKQLYASWPHACQSRQECCFACGVIASAVSILAVCFILQVRLHFR